MSSGRFNLKQKGDATTLLLEWPKSRTLATTNAGDNVAQQELLIIAGQKMNGSTTVADSLAVSFKTVYTLTI